jgi:putative peptidoglycan lipid II flippase
MNAIAKPIIKAFNFLWASPIIKDSFIATFFNILGKSVGFFIPFLIAAWYGVGGETDAFFFSYGVIFFLTSIFSTVLGAVVVPFAAEADRQGAELGDFLGSLWVGSGFIMLLVALSFAALALPLFKTVTGFQPAQVKLAYLLSLETLPIVMIVVLSSLAEGVLNARMAFIVTQLSIGVRSIFILFCIFATKNSLGIHAIPAGYVLGETMRLVYLYAALRKKGIYPKFTLPNRRSLDFFKKASVQMIGVTILYFSLFIDRTVASWLSVGSVSLLEYANKLFFVPLTLLGEGFFMVLLSHWSYRDRDLIGDEVIKTSKIVLFCSLPLGALLFFLREPLTGLAYGWGNFPQTKIRDLSSIVGMYLLGLPLALVRGVLVRGLLALKDTSSLAKVGCWMSVTNIGLDFLLLFILGLPGIALANSLAGVVGAAGLFYYFNKCSRREVVYGLS